MPPLLKPKEKAKVPGTCKWCGLLLSAWPNGMTACKHCDSKCEIKQETGGCRACDNVTEAKG